MAFSGYEHIEIHFGEIWLKGRNRSAFVNRLYQNIKSALKCESYDRLDNSYDRFVLLPNKKSDLASIENRLSKVFGISWFAPVMSCKNNINDMLKHSSKLIKGQDFRVEAHRAYKGTKFNSQDIVKGFIDNQKKIGFNADRESKNVLHINVLKDKSVMYTNKIHGAGGLPLGVSGRAVVLLSGGIDSPVASYYAMKRGLEPIYLHMHAFSDNKTAEKSKMKSILNVLSEYSPDSKVYFVPSHPFTVSILGVKPKYELVLFKRFLYRLAEQVAEKENAEVVATGESLGQVASQTVRNLIASERGSKLLAMRPLIGFDKQEIIDIAKRIGTYGLSIQEYPDVCSLRARNPSTGARSDIIDELYKKHKLDKAIDESLKKASAMKIGKR
ncbi:MAG: tRNA 4-thiouridine(8) synthase ThiI [Candidatus Marsarchaeota archaeon]|nr:tRNA 4-thiouridine(8) synthase ThiI [Candidatus Marsarchaeota archaeon]